MLVWLLVLCRVDLSSVALCDVSCCDMLSSFVLCCVVSDVVVLRRIVLSCLWCCVVLCWFGVRVRCVRLACCVNS